MHLTHHDDGKQRWQSHEVGVTEQDFYNQEHDIFSHNFMDLTGYGETKEQAVEDFKRKFRYLLDEWNTFAKLLLDSDIAENEMIEVDCFGKPIKKERKKYENHSSRIDDEDRGYPVCNR